MSTRNAVLEQLLETLRIKKPESVPQTRACYLQTGETVPSVFDRLEWADSERVVLVIPPDASILTGRLDLLRIQRYASNHRIQIALVTVEPDQRTIARELGIPVFSTLERAERSRWRRRSSTLPYSEAIARVGQRPQPKELRPSDSRISGYILIGMTAGVVLVVSFDLLSIGHLDFELVRKDVVYGIVGGAAAGVAAFGLARLFNRYLPGPFRWLRWVLMTLVFALGILAPVGAGYVILPEARLTLKPAEVPVSVITRITVLVPAPDQDGGLEEIDFEGQRIAGRRISAEVGAEAVAGATGTSEVPSSRATGAVVFSNLLAQDYTIGENTVVRTSAGTAVRFVTTGDVTVPPLGQAAVGIEAVEPGPKGNVDVGLINRVEGAAARAVRVTNPEPTRGGGVSQVRAVSQEDRDALRRTLLAELRAQGYERVLERPAAEGGLRDGEYLIPGSVRVFQVLHETFDRFATEEAESIKLDMRVLVTGVVVDLGDAYNLTRHVLSRRVPEGYQLTGVEYRPGLMGDNVVGEGTLTFFVEADGVAEASLEHDQVKHWLRGKSTEDGLALLSTAWQKNELHVAELPQVEIWPDWAAGRFPWLIWRIQVAEVPSE
jgi:hypothetical protein